jgi:hypothetical protein
VATIASVQARNATECVVSHRDAALAQPDRVPPASPAPETLHDLAQLATNRHWKAGPATRAPGSVTVVRVR